MAFCVLEAGVGAGHALRVDLSDYSREKVVTLSNIIKI